MSLESLAAVILGATAAITVGTVGTAHADIPVTILSGGPEGSAITGFCGVHYRATLTPTPGVPDSLRLEIQGLDPFGPAAGPNGCDAPVNYTWVNTSTGAADYGPRYLNAHAIPGGGDTSMADLPTGPGRIQVSVTGTQNGFSLNSFYLAQIDLP
ncbi:hypothetical protein OHB26_12850 [Nocardia sp. NBC_01503]|uniref:hypothetical protein n=1 Tax=Nocardia sp. NBC_01503 TaxID=2975997 RepID=UPI002E7C1665|nr:hypothetical protein [Nocardia sp. NBC_01503]WTL34996.1 hypothetical protein OHB26_12850 [Nocardia sp. NBC_01503]